MFLSHKASGTDARSEVADSFGREDFGFIGKRMKVSWTP